MTMWRTAAIPHQDSPHGHASDPSNDSTLDSTPEFLSWLSMRVPKQRLHTRNLPMTPRAQVCRLVLTRPKNCTSEKEERGIKNINSTVLDEYE